MGLDVVAHQNIQKLELDTNIIAIDELGADPQFGNYWRVEKHDYFYDHAEGLDDDAFYSSGDEVARFSAGSYSGYSAFREWLVELVDLANTEEKYKDMLPEGYEITFFEFDSLCNFSDCDGVIGPVYAQRLHEEFKAFEKIAESVSRHENHLYGMYEVYKNFLKAFDMARKNGMVRFT